MGKKGNGARVIASVGHGNNVAFYAVADGENDYEELLSKVERKSLWHFPGLLETDNVRIRISKTYLDEMSIPDSIFNQALENLPRRVIGEKEIPSEIAVPLEFELAPVVGFGFTIFQTDFQTVLKKRNLLCKTEICTLEGCAPTKVVFVEVNGRPFWRIQGEEDRHISAQITESLTYDEEAMAKMLAK